jgi:hypothetical protein
MDPQEFLKQLAAVWARREEHEREAEALKFEAYRMIHDALQPDVRLVTGDAIAEIIHTHHSWPHRIRDEYPAKLAAWEARKAQPDRRAYPRVRPPAI